MTCNIPKRERDELLKIRDQINAMLAEPEEPKEIKLGSFRDLTLWKVKDGWPELRFRGCPAAAATFPDSVKLWLTELLEAQRPRVYREGDKLPERFLWWASGSRKWFSHSGGAILGEGIRWLPFPEAPDD